MHALSHLLVFAFLDAFICSSINVRQMCICNIRISITWIWCWISSQALKCAVCKQQTANQWSTCEGESAEAILFDG